MFLCLIKMWSKHELHLVGLSVRWKKPRFAIEFLYLSTIDELYRISMCMLPIKIMQLVSWGSHCLSTVTKSASEYWCRLYAPNKLKATLLTFKFNINTISCCQFAFTLFWTNIILINTATPPDLYVFCLLYTSRCV